MDATVGESIFAWSLVVISLSLGTWAFVDVLRRPAAEFASQGSSRTTWIVILSASGVAAFVMLMAMFILLGVSTYYLVRVRRRFDQRHA
jgi:hypothetical protein